MKKTSILIEEFQAEHYRERLKDVYVDEDKLSYEKERYIGALRAYEELFGEDEVELYSAPGRTEIGGNHTDHQHGEVLAASVNCDAVAVTGRTDDRTVEVVSEGCGRIRLTLDELAKSQEEEGTTRALIKGVLAALQDKGYAIGGFRAYIISDVLIGAGLSSSAAFETLIGTIISGLYHEGRISPITLALAGQYAENTYFGKPCGLMDQTASAVGSVVHIDFADPKQPVVDRVEIDLEQYGYSLCITDTKGSHADLTAEYAAIPIEMKRVAAYFGQEVLRGISVQQLREQIGVLREYAGDRAVLRAIHFVEENIRVEQEVAALRSGNMKEFLELVKSSGSSSFRYLQNIYSNSDAAHQGVSVALAASELFLGENGVSRVHGGGFAGTIQAFVKNTCVRDYQRYMDTIFGDGACSVLKIRKYGGMKIL